MPRENKLQKNISFEQIQELKKMIEGKDKLILEKDKLIKGLQDKIVHH